jgi:uncharacterized protein
LESSSAAAHNTTSAPAFASLPIPPARIARIDEMLTVTGVKPTLLKSIAQGQKQLKWYAQAQTGTLSAVPKEQEPKEHQITSDYTVKMDHIADTQLTWDKARLPVFRYCADNFTDEQMDSIIAFYKSPAGKAMLEKGPELNQKTYDALQALQTQTKPLTDQATQDMKDHVQALRQPLSQASTASVDHR